MKSFALNLATVLLFLCIACQPDGGKSDPDPNPATTAGLPGHPRLVWLKGEEQALRQNLQADVTWAKVHTALLTEAEAVRRLPVLERVLTGRRLLDVSREALRRIMILSYAWRMTRQADYLSRAERELLAVSAFSDWNPSHFLDVAEMTMGVAIGYDWLHEGLSAETRATVRDAILKKGLEPSLLARNNSWLRVTNNWNQVCNAGMTFGALAIYEDKPDLAKQLVDRAVQTVGISMKEYDPDGAYPEGYGYWGYGTSFNVLLINALERAFGNDYGLTTQSGLLKTAAYLQHMTGPTGGAFNYSDNGSGGTLQPAMFWFAGKLKDPSLLWVERGRLQAGDATRVPKDRLGPMLLIWGASQNLTTSQAPAGLLWAGQGKNPVALMRTSWTDPTALFVGLKAGSPSVNHGHMDVGSFVVEADGVRWAMDMGMQDYNSLESKGVDLWNMSQNSQRWQVYRYNNFVHNTLTVNNALQRVQGMSTILTSSATPAFLNATTDLTTLYGGALTRAMRGVAIVDKAYVMVRDELEVGASPATVRWTMVTTATVNRLSGNRLELNRDGKKLILHVAEPAQVTLTTAPAMPANDYDAPNPGVSLISFEVRLSAGTRTPLTVLFLPEKTANGFSTPTLKPLAEWPR